jgi:N-methylhydantoinase A
VSPSFTVGVDIGGTFTDCVVIDDRGRIATGKVPTTPEDRSVGFFGSIEDAVSKWSLGLPDVMQACDRIVHGTTTGTNALVTRRGARVGLLATAGHGDSMRVINGRGRSLGRSPEELTDFVVGRSKPYPFFDRDLCIEIPERVDAHGRVIVALDVAAVERAVADLVSRGAEALAISFLWSTKHPAHEIRAAEIAAKVAPGLFISRGSELSGRQGEYERTAAAVLNAYIGPLMVRYIERIEARARQLGYRGPVLFSQCAGGSIGVEEAKRVPIFTVNSGPVAGVMACAMVSRELAEQTLLTTDMGGTTFDVSLVRGHQPIVRDVSSVERHEVAIPMVDVSSIGTGGGSVAWVDSTGRLNVGPGSAGAVPGPVCYGRGGEQVTVTDADLVVGMIEPTGFLHGDFELDLEAAKAAIAALGRQLGLGLYETASGIIRVADAKMADLIRRMSEFRGIDPREVTILAFGGAGPVHAAACAREAGIPKVVVPLPDVAPVWSAGGAANGDVSHITIMSVLLPLPAEPGALSEAMVPLEHRTVSLLESEGFDRSCIRVERAVRMRYAVQVFDVEVPLPRVPSTTADLERLVEDFTRVYEERFGRNSGFAEGGIVVSGLQVRAVGETPKASFLRPAEAAIRVPRSDRKVYWAELGRHEMTLVLDLGGGWGPEDVGDLTGPTLLALPDTTVVIRPGQLGRLRADGNIEIHCI